MTALKAKNQRLTLLILAAVAVIGAVLLAMWGLRDNAAFFYAPADVARKGIPLERNIRIGGMVKGGSIKRAPDGVTIDFVVGDETPATIPVRFTGIAPDLFKENSGVVAEGKFQPSGLFVADEILAKHDENYMPPELARDGAKHKTETLQ
jgi:cytochrome c-type biogenesis protein CcmE